MRRRVLIFALVTIPFITSAAPDVIKIDSGQVSGTLVNGVRVFKGIPFAAPPVGDLRWRPPQPVASWTGVRAADAFGARYTSREAMARALVRLADQNLADPEPPRWEELWFYSHPAIASRVRALGVRWEEYAA